MANILEKILGIVFGALFAASLYVIVSASAQGQIVSFYAMRVGAILGWLGIPALALALNIRRPNIWTFAGSILIAPFLFLFIMAISVRLPGAEWAPPEVLQWLAAIPAIPVLLFAIRVPGAIPLTLLSCVVCLFAGLFAVHFATQWTLQSQIDQTLRERGCVVVGWASKRQVTAADEIDTGIILGESSEPVYFVSGSHYLVWSYSSFGVAKRRDGPIQYPLTEDIKCD